MKHSLKTSWDQTDQKSWLLIQCRTSTSLFQTWPSTTSTDHQTSINRATETSSASPVREDDVEIQTLVEEKHLKEQLCAHIRCPEPFSTVTLFPSSCTCDCVKRGDSNCEKIKRGLRRLTGTVASCVRRGLCHVPVCEYTGDFDMMKGMCPKKGSDNNQSFRHNKKHYIHERDWTDIHSNDREMLYFCRMWCCPEFKDKSRVS